MKKLMIVLALSGLVVGCANEKNAGGTSDQNQMNTGSDSSAPAANYDTNNVAPPPAQP